MYLVPYKALLEMPLAYQVTLKKACHKHLITWTPTLSRVNPDPGDGFILRLLTRCTLFDILLFKNRKIDKPLLKRSRI